MAEFLLDPLVACVVGGMLLTGLYWSLVLAMRNKGETQWPLIALASA
ncbi:hypothetical protein H3005_09590 [Stenotrophomonas sp. Br8]|nr:MULTISPECIES: hypothetical protein [Stenotrophomonas]MBD3682117.1 hypothetical protein [Stenotrophomonas sp. Br8]